MILAKRSQIHIYNTFPNPIYIRVINIRLSPLVFFSRNWYCHDLFIKIAMAAVQRYNALVLESLDMNNFSFANLSIPV